MKKQKANIIKNFIYSLKKIAKVDKVIIIESFFSAIIRSLVVFMYPYILKTAISAIESGKEFKDLVISVVLIVSIVCFLSIINHIFQNDIFRRRNKISVIFTKEFYQMSIHNDYEKFERPESQDAFEKAKGAIYSYNGMLGLFYGMFQTLSNIGSFLLSSAIIFGVNGWLILIITGLSICKLLLESYNAKKGKEKFSDMTPGLWRKITYTDNISRNLSIGKDLRIYEMNKFISFEREETIKEFLSLYKKNEIRKNIIHFLVSIIKSLDEVFLYIFLVNEVLNHGMSIADFTFATSAVRHLTGAISQIITHYTGNLEASLKVNDYREFLSIDLKHDMNYQKFEYENINNIEIEFKNVSYSYYMQEGSTLKNLSFKINKGEKIALVGHNGAGKTTLIKLLCGLYHPTSGEILINGVNIETIDRQVLNKIIAPVFQDSNHYALSVLENLTMQSKEKVDIEKVNKALELTQLTTKIDKLPDKLDTVITRDLDDTGIDLSGGESQKLSIARAVYKDSQLMILDEPTSALDAISEYELYNNFSKIIKDHSAIFISHRLSSTRFCDRIFYLDNGELKEVGSHDELMKKDGEYKKLFNMQAEYYKGGDLNEA